MLPAGNPTELPSPGAAGSQGQASPARAALPLMLSITQQIIPLALMTLRQRGK